MARPAARRGRARGERSSILVGRVRGAAAVGFALWSARRRHRRTGALASGAFDEEVAALGAAAESSGVTEALFLEACLHALVARLSGETEPVLSGLADGRLQPDLAGALGPYAQFVPIRSRIGRERPSRS